MQRGYCTDFALVSAVIIFAWEGREKIEERKKVDEERE